MTETKPQQEYSSGIIMKNNVSLQPVKVVKMNQVAPIIISLDPPHENELQRTYKSAKKTIKTQKSCKSVKIVVSMPSNYFGNSVNHSQLENMFQIKTDFSLGSFLKGIEFEGSNLNPYTCIKTDKFPYSRFKFTENQQNGRTFELVSNFWGNKYNLQLEGDNVFSISFTVSCGISNTSRQFQIFALCPGINHSHLQKGNDQKELSKLYFIGENHNKIMKLNSLQPQMSETKGYLSLELARTQVVASVQNCSILDEQGAEVMEMYKLDQVNQVYEICFSKKIEREWSFAFALASLDFKIAIQ